MIPPFRERLKFWVQVWQFERFNFVIRVIIFTFHINFGFLISLLSKTPKYSPDLQKIPKTIAFPSRKHFLPSPIKKLFYGVFVIVNRYFDCKFHDFFKNLISFSFSHSINDIMSWIRGKRQRAMSILGGIFCYLKLHPNLHPLRG